MKSLVYQTIFLTQKSKYLDKNLDIMKPCYSKQSLFASSLALCYIEVQVLLITNSAFYLYSDFHQVFLEKHMNSW